MPKTIKYVGNVDRWSELAVTGGQALWRISQQEQRADSEAEMLLLTGLFTLVQETTQLPLSVSPAGKRVVTLPEGQVLNVSGGAGTAGVVYRLDPVLGGTNSLQSWPVGAGALAPIGPYVGEQRFLVTCAAGFVDVATVAAVLSAIGQVQVDKNNTVTKPGVPAVFSADVRKLPNGQPVGITRPVRNMGKLMADFSGSQWGVANGLVEGSVTRNYQAYDALTGAVTGIPSFTSLPGTLKVAIANETSEIRLGFANIKTQPINGQFMLICYVENMVGNKPGQGGPRFSLNVEMSTESASGSMINALRVSFTASQVREGWNVLKFRMRDPAAYIVGSGAAEDHPFAVVASSYGTGVDTDIVNKPIRGAIRINFSGLDAPGVNVYLDSMWTGWDTQAQIVLGADTAGASIVNMAAPLCMARGYKMYAAINVAGGMEGQTVIDMDSNTSLNAKVLQEMGMELISHSMTHVTIQNLTDMSRVAYELQMQKAWMHMRGFNSGLDFYASPVSSTSLPSEKIYAALGFKLQRHARKSNTSVTPWGIDNPNHIGASDIGSGVSDRCTRVTGGVATTTKGLQRFSEMKQCLDAMVAYGDSWFPFFHDVTKLGDSGSGEDLTGSSITVTYSALDKLLGYCAQLEAAGLLHVCDGMTGFYYGSGR